MTGVLAAILIMKRVQVALTANDIADFAIQPSDAFATFAIANDGSYSGDTGSGGSVGFGEWIAPANAAGAAYEVSVSSSGPVGGTVDTWLSLDTSRSWSISQTSVGIKSVVLSVSIRRASTGAVLATADFTLTAEVTL